MIRAATIDDIPAIVAMGRRFVEGAWTIPPCDISIAQTVAALLDDENGLVLVGEEDGSLFATAGAVVYPWYFNRSVLAGQELWWWSEGQKAKEMIRIMEGWARQRGATTFAMSRIDGMRDDALHRVFCRDGYSPSEHVYMRSLGNGEISSISGDRGRIESAR